MNILPKKRWHVRTKENIARVRKDEAEAAEKERQERTRIENADREARINVLRQKSKQKLLESGLIDKHEGTVFETETSSAKYINLFENVDSAIQTTNKEHDKEVKKQQEDYEKKIGYLTYLGQDTNEALKKRNWYEVLPEESRFKRTSAIRDTYVKLVLKDDDGIPIVKPDEPNSEVDWKIKQKADPVNSFKTYCHSTATSSSALSKKQNHEDYKKNKKQKQKKNKRDKKDYKREKEEKLRKLREMRLKREKDEHLRTQIFLSGNDMTKEKSIDINQLQPKYNSQFNPQLARQNFKK